MERKKYNFHSERVIVYKHPFTFREIMNFFKNFLEVNFPGHAQQASDQTSSGRKLYCSGLMDTSKSAGVRLIGLWWIVPVLLLVKHQFWKHNPL